MSTKVTMPQLGESVVEGTIARWLKKPGDHVDKYEPLVEVMTDKVTVEVPSTVAGNLLEIFVPEGQTVAVGTEIAAIEEAPMPVAAGSGDGTHVAAARAAVEQAGAQPSEKRSSPLVRRLAQEHGVDLAKVAGTGLGGRVTKEDVLDYISSHESTAPAETPPAPPTAAPVTPAAEPAAAPAPPPTPTPLRARMRPEDQEFIPVTLIRKSIADHMVRSKQTSPHAWTMTEVDMTEVIKWRQSIREGFRRQEGVDLTYVPFFISAVVEALREHPTMNASWAEDKIVLKKRINIGIAIDTTAGLMVPVIHDADQKSIAGLAVALADLIERARSGRLTLDDVQGGTFTVNNPGTFGSIVSVPIINQPQAGIITMESIVKRAVVHDDAIGIRSMMNICLSFDHRINDGGTAGRFLQSVRKHLESYRPGIPIY